MRFRDMRNMGLVTRRTDKEAKGCRECALVGDIRELRNRPINVVRAALTSTEAQVQLIHEPWCASKSYGLLNQCNCASTEEYKDD